MQVFIIGSPLETAKALDPKRLNKQIIECGQILDALSGFTAWRNHPAVLQYRGYEEWLEHYMACLEAHKMGNNNYARCCNRIANQMTPDWHTYEYYDQMKRRLFEKDEEHYKQWSHLGKSLDNWYYIDGKFVKYRNGRKVEE